MHERYDAPMLIVKTHSDRGGVGPFGGNAGKEKETREREKIEVM
jgi:hypothetical protein